MPYRELTEAGRIGTITGVAGQLLHRGLVQNFVLFFVQFYVSFFKSSPMSSPTLSEFRQRCVSGAATCWSVPFYTLPFRTLPLTQYRVSSHALQYRWLARCLVGLSSVVPFHI